MLPNQINNNTRLNLKEIHGLQLQLQFNQTLFNSIQFNQIIQFNFIVIDDKIMEQFANTQLVFNNEKTNNLGANLNQTMPEKLSKSKNKNNNSKWKPPPIFNAGGSAKAKGISFWFRNSSRKNSVFFTSYF